MSLVFLCLLVGVAILQLATYHQGVSIMAAVDDLKAILARIDTLDAENPEGQA